MRRLAIADDAFAIRGGFAISRGRRTHAHVVTVTLEEDGHAGRGECTPYARYGESLEGVIAAIEAIRPALEAGATRADVQALLPAGAARNAVDCALWDLEARASGHRVHQLLGLPAPGPLVTAYTLSLDTPEAMARAAYEHRDRPLLTIKLGGEGDPERLRAVMGHCGTARVIADANEAWSPDRLWDWLELAAGLGVAMVEQPLPADLDAVLADRARPLPVCADESAHDRASLPRLAGRYDLVNIKLDKTGGLTEALAFEAEARAAGFGIFVGCMMGSSLAMAPAFLLGAGADYVDLDAPLLLSEDREPRLAFTGSVIEPPGADLWG